MTAVDQCQLLAANADGLRALHMLYNLDTHPDSRFTVMLAAGPSRPTPAISSSGWDRGLARLPLKAIGLRIVQESKSRSVADRFLRSEEHRNIFLELPVYPPGGARVIWIGNP